MAAIQGCQRLRLTVVYNARHHRADMTLKAQAGSPRASRATRYSRAGDVLRITFSLVCPWYLFSYTAPPLASR
eukprot:5897704-Prymnesium_polylepis.2